MNDMSKTPAYEPAAAPALAGDPDGETKVIRDILADHARKLDVMFLDFCTHAAEVFKEWPQEAQSLIRLALRAQTNCRVSLDALAKLDRANRAYGAGGEK